MDGGRVIEWSDGQTDEQLDGSMGTGMTDLQSISLPGGLQPVLGRFLVLATLEGFKLLLILFRRLRLYKGDQHCRLIMHSLRPQLMLTSGITDLYVIVCMTSSCLCKLVLLLHPGTLATLCHLLR